MAGGLRRFSDTGGFGNVLLADGVQVALLRTDSMASFFTCMK